ncbi:MAG: hypothetical protein D3925_07925 [Candidatus Electrothrix sp. AR5]|nr:hypothetical protein [Candidatus Electrothrix sp. AR5]
MINGAEGVEEFLLRSGNELVQKGRRCDDHGFGILFYRAALCLKRKCSFLTGLIEQGLLNRPY